MKFLSSDCPINFKMNLFLAHYMNTEICIVSASNHICLSHDMKTGAEQKGPPRGTADWFKETATWEVSEAGEARQTGRGCWMRIGPAVFKMTERDIPGSTE